MFANFPRMLWWALLTVALMCFALLVQAQYPGNVFAVTLYKAHLMALGGWGGYWLDRALFPYARPDKFCPSEKTSDEENSDGDVYEIALTYPGNPLLAAACMLRRVIVVAACLVCVGLGA